MTEVASNNYAIIEKLVERHFGLDEKSIKIFKETLHSPFIDEIYKDVDEDLRISIPFGENICLVDEGWIKFKKYFKVFIDDNKITYENFRDNSFKRGKSSLKLFKNLKTFMKEDFLVKGEATLNFYKSFYNFSSTIESIHKRETELSFNKTLDRVLDIIGTIKMPSSKNLKVVVSLNFADWLLSSTAETWSSCLDMESNYDSCYWSGLPGTIVDKNRSMIYVTDGEMKEYKGIKVEHCISRSWVLTDKDLNLRWLRFYPSEIINSINAKIFFKDTPFSSIDEINRDVFKSKYNIDLLRYTFGITSFIFQDHTEFKKKANKVYIFGGNNGFTGFDETGELIDENNLECGTPLSKLIENGKSISEYQEETSLCFGCGDRVPPDEIFTALGQEYCESCFEEMFFACEECSRITSSDDNDGNGFCPSCHSNIFATCFECGEEFDKNDLTKTKKGYICECCKEEKKEA